MTYWPFLVECDGLLKGRIRCENNLPYLLTFFILFDMTLLKLNKTKLSFWTLVRVGRQVLVSLRWDGAARTVNIWAPTVPTKKVKTRLLLSIYNPCFLSPHLTCWAAFTFQLTRGLLGLAAWPPFDKSQFSFPIRMRWAVIGGKPVGYVVLYYFLLRTRCWCKGQWRVGPPNSSLIDVAWLSCQTGSV